MNNGLNTSVTTVGYGTIPVATIGERILAMCVMLVGAIICDAGITAVLTSLISGWDMQTGTNNRRICCSKQFMTSNRIDSTLQVRILKFFEYADGELLNIDEKALLKDLSPSLKRDILSHFCYLPLKNSSAFIDFADGEIMTLLNLVDPYIAVPGESLSTVGTSCSAVYVLNKGQVMCTDIIGGKSFLPTGALIGHFITRAESKRFGDLRNICSVTIQSITVKNKYNFGNNFVTLKFNRLSFCSKIKKTGRGDENRYGKGTNCAR